MSRKSTSRKLSTFEEAAIPDGMFAPSYPLHRADPEPVAARRQVLRLLTGFTFLWLPVHCGICWLSTYSLDLATAAVLVTAAALLAVALAKWLALEDVLQKLPLLLVLALVGVGLVFFSSQQLPRGLFASADFVGLVFILIAVVSVLGSLYRPLAAAYQTVTLKTHFRDLCVGAAAMLLSIGLVNLAHAIPRFGLEVFASAVAGGYAGLVVTEYAAWARANPDQSLERAMAFGKSGKAQKDVIGPRGAVLGAALFGLSCAMFVVVCQNVPSPSPQFRRFVLRLAEEDHDKTRDTLALLLGVGLTGMLSGLIVTCSSLSATRPGNPLLTLRLAWKAVVVFLTYPETTHPLVHRLHISWLRPVSVRMALTGLVLVTAVTAAYAPVERPKPVEPQPAVYAPPAYASPAILPPPLFREIAPRDPESPRTGQSPEVWSGPELGPQPVSPAPQEAPAIGEKAVDPNAPGVFAIAVGLILGPPALLFLMVWLVGLTVLPTYFHYFEKPQASAVPG